MLRFSWISKGKMAGLAFPSEPESLQQLSEQEKIKHLVSLTDDQPGGKADAVEAAGMEWHQISIPNHQVPTKDQVKKYA